MFSPLMNKPFGACLQVLTGERHGSHGAAWDLFSPWPTAWAHRHTGVAGLHYLLDHGCPLGAVVPDG